MILGQLSRGILKNRTFMEVNKQEEVFVKFLRSNEAYDAYMKYFTIWHSRYQTFSAFIEMEEPKSYIDCAFFWDNTQQGQDYWYHLSILWQAVLNS